MHVNDSDYLFEVSWEVCNKVGGIHTVLKTKTQSAVEHFKDRYYLIGPDFGDNPEFEETTDGPWDIIKPAFERRNLICRYGRWNIPGEPRVILVRFQDRYTQDELLFQLWKDFGVNSLTGGWDYIEPVLFSTACGEIIEILNEHVVGEDDTVVAQFHEWMSGAGLLYLKKHVPEIGTVFTSHATMLGRSLAGHEIDIYSDLEGISPHDAAAQMNITAKHSLETAVTRECDCFTTVSEITAHEAHHFLGREPQIVLPNGINIAQIPGCDEKPETIQMYRDTVLGFASQFLQKNLHPKKTKLFIISGRYEYHNKGIDLFLESLAAMNNTLNAQNSPHQIVALLCVIGGHMGVSPETRSTLKGSDVPRTGICRICTHRLEDPQHDPIWTQCSKSGLLNLKDDHVNIIFMPVYLDGLDGLLNLTYYHTLSACDIGVFPSYYEPWGYTPLESTAHCVPTITTDLAGFGLWVKRNFENTNRGVIVLDYHRQSHEQIVHTLTKHLGDILEWSDEEITQQKEWALEIARKTDWTEFFPSYLTAYSIASKMAHDRMRTLDASAYTQDRFYAGTDSTQPRFRQFSIIAELPENINKLRDIAHNLWWTWNPDVQELFSRLDPNLWSNVAHNPIELLEQVSHERLWEAAENDSYMRLYNSCLQWFENFTHRDDKPTAEPTLNLTKPIAYFSTEYGLHESLPIYSGGLGILSGDHLKSASDLNMPLIGIGLLYKNGYFTQIIDKNGNQVALYPDNDFSRMPIRVVERKKGEPLKINVNLPGRKLHAQVWKVDVGRVPLYLLDTFIPDNSNQDMLITSRLYGADQRLRIEQEIMLGIGGVRLIKALGITPSLYHLNEGHSAFLLLERVRQLMHHNGLTFFEACEAVKATSVFTTHSPVEAANERFDVTLMKAYFSEYVKDFGISWETFWELGREVPGEGKPFFMPVLAMKLSCFSNAVSRLHGTVARRMWKNVWSGFDESETPICHITNGIHVQSWIAPEMRRLFETYIGVDWYSENFDEDAWDKVHEIPDILVWQRHMDLKIKMIESLKYRLSCDCERQGISPKLVQKKSEALNPNALLIGSCRRFATYKRGALAFENIDRLIRILNNADMPVQIIFSGKAHPNDEAGKRIIRTIYEYSMDERFIDKIFFIENYDLEIARHIVQGIDVWLNNPLRPREASGTSGMKVVSNGGLNLSIRDGWWDEAFDTTNGWAIGDVREFSNMESSNLHDSQILYDLLEHVVIPLYFKRTTEGIPDQWVYMMKESIRTLVPAFNTHRMLREYFSSMYRPTALRGARLQQDKFARAKSLAQWKLRIASRFSTDHIRWFKTRGVRGDTLNLGETFEIEAGIEPGKLRDDEIRVELVIGETGENGRIMNPRIITMSKSAEIGAEGVSIYSGTYNAISSGRFLYGIRVMPTHPDLLHYQEMGLVHWG